MKTKEELTALKEEVAQLNGKLAELTDDELKEVTGGGFSIFIDGNFFRRFNVNVPGIDEPDVNLGTISGDGVK